MAYTHADLLSYDDIDSDVDQIFKAFCDTSLIECAKERVTADAKDTARDARVANLQRYWQRVLHFRRSNLSLTDRPDFAASAAEVKPNLPRQPVSDDDARRVRGFLYWFDVRAEYWSRHAADQTLLDTLAPADDLGELYRKALVVQARIHQAQQASLDVAVGAWDVGVPPVLSIPDGNTRPVSQSSPGQATGTGSGGVNLDVSGTASQDPNLEVTS